MRLATRLGVVGLALTVGLAGCAGDPDVPLSTTATSDRGVVSTATFYRPRLGGGTYPVPERVVHLNRNDPSTPLGAICWAVTEVGIGWGEVLYFRVVLRADPAMSAAEHDAAAANAMLRVASTLDDARAAVAGLDDADLPVAARAFRQSFLNDLNQAIDEVSAVQGSPQDRVDAASQVWDRYFVYDAYPQSTELDPLLLASPECHLDEDP